MEIELDKVAYQYPDNGFCLRVPSLVVPGGSRVAVVGPSGTGKTTLLNLMAGVLVPDEGSVHLGDHTVSSLHDTARRRLRLQHIGFVFQTVDLLDYLDVRDNILLPYRINRGLNLNAEAMARAAELARAVGLADKLDRRIDRLSQGERQRVGVCRALVHRPAVVLADEPTSALDPGTADTVLDEMFSLVESQGNTLVMLTHDRSALDRFERVIYIDDGVASIAEHDQGSRTLLSGGGG
ncbi:MAG: ABC transporter ATP-binding protein [Planctomycetota bacterium]